MIKFFLSIFFLTTPFHDQPIDLGYVEISKIHPGQVRYSKAHVEQKILQAIGKGAVVQTKDGYQLKYDGGRSLLPQNEALPVVLSSKGYVLVDGHHHTILSMHYHAKTIPVKQIADFSQMSTEAFWKKAEEIGLAHLKTLNGKKRIPPSSFSDLEDDPGRYFAAITSRKYSADLSHSKGAEYPLWIKVGKDIPFIEFYISDALLEQGIEYDNAMGNHPSEEFVEKARLALLKAKIPGLKVLSKRLHHKEIQYKNDSFNDVVIYSQNNASDKNSLLK